jgi:ubiquinone/menaquinone biosynthesis C-methylase UbiE
MLEPSSHVIAFYNRHPISRDQILASVRERRGNIDALQPEDLYPHDQDHYGGLEAVDALAQRIGARPGLDVVDLCAGLGGPARYLAAHYGANVVCVELNAKRAAGARELTDRVGLARRVRVVRGDAQRIPLKNDCVDAVISQEALLHVPDKGAAIREAHRVLSPGGLLAFTDWALPSPLAQTDQEAMWQGIAAQTVQTYESYRALVLGAGFQVRSEEDLTAQWGVILAERFRMYTELRDVARRAGNPQGDDAFYSAYARFVALVQTRQLGGVRIVAQKK